MLNTTGSCRDWTCGLQWAATVALLLAFLVLAWLFILSPSPSVIGQEQNSVFAVLRYQLTGRLFTEPDQFPFNALQYGPVHYQVIRAVGWLLRQDPVATQVYRVGRGVAVLANVLTIGILWYALRRSSSASAGTAALIAVTTLFALMPWGFVIHPDPLHTLLVVAGAVLTLSAGPAVSPSRVGLSSGIIAVAAFVKLTGVFFLALPLVLALLHPRPRARLGSYLVAAVFACALVALIVFIGNGGGTMGRNWLLALRQPADVKAAILGTYLPVLQRQFVLVAAVLVAVIMAVRQRSSQLGAVTLCAVWAGTVGLVLGVKIGAGANYFLLFIVFAVIAGVAAAFPADGHPVHTPSDEAGRRLWLVGLAVLYAGVQISWIWSQIGNARNDRTAEFRSLQTILRSIPDDKAAILELDGNLAIVAPERVVLATSDVVSWVAVAAILPQGSLAAALQQHKICWAVVARETYDALARGVAPSALSAVQTLYLNQVRALFEDAVVLPERVLLRARTCPTP